jgi:hypothetical protein
VLRLSRRYSATKEWTIHESCCWNIPEFAPGQ